MTITIMMTCFLSDGYYVYPHDWLLQEESRKSSWLQGGWGSLTISRLRLHIEPSAGEHLHQSIVFFFSITGRQGALECVFLLASVKTAILVEFDTGRWQVPCLIILQGSKVCSVFKVAVDTPGTPSEHLSDEEKRLQQTGVSNVPMCWWGKHSIWTFSPVNQQWSPSDASGYWPAPHRKFEFIRPM